MEEFSKKNLRIPAFARNQRKSDSDILNSAAEQKLLGRGSPLLGLFSFNFWVSR